MDHFLKWCIAIGEEGRKALIDGMNEISKEIQELPEETLEDRIKRVTAFQRKYFKLCQEIDHKFNR